ncbi:hypothetical protein ACIBIZ_23630 [Nonomuraea spiralis]|uniref:Lipoprotein n=1 Tax=Nonomuraea spiralis TaxID=46182 RepID=A0ABV5IET8_9ACTN|nr:MULTISPECIES: hypothetical protein [Nonomuraea]RSN10257.1 hypothetical protein DMB42_15035 [Nonomuraea sp. WAC 01424]GGS70251.1 hypothetical protein GCM10010176_011100 [Nonomuraea spiralis]
MTTHPRLAALVLLAGLAAACSSGGGGGYAAAGQKAAPAAAPQTVEQLAAKVGCKPRMQVDAAEIRTGYCRTADGQFFVTTFASQSGKDAWMDAAPEYNPHLVGSLWTVLSSRKVLELLKERLGGDLHLKDHRTNQMRTVG